MPKHILPFLCVGRVVYVKTPEDDWGWGIIEPDKLRTPQEIA